MKIVCFFCGIVLLIIPKVSGQFSDSLQINIGTTIITASEKYQPLWVVANRYGTLTNRKTDLSTHLRIINKHTLKRRSQQKDTNNSSFSINYGVDLYNNNHFKNVIIKEGFLKTGFKFWELRGGRYEEIIGEVDPELSSGSLGVSGNALPIPKVGVAVNDYTIVPLTKGWLQFKGQLSHGWLGNSNYLKNAFLHQKSFYLRVGKRHLLFYGGLNHFAQWGGTHPSGQAPSRFKDFLRIVVGAKGDASDPVYQQGPIDIANAVGNHLIIPDFGVKFTSKKSTFKLYTQTMFEKGISDSANQRDRLAGLKLLSRDRLVGLSWETNKNYLINIIVLEGIYTKYQGGPIVYRGRDNYYNNATYQTGWEYQTRIIGTPLFLNRENAIAYNLDSNPNNLSGWNIVSNRIKGMHLGIKGNITDKLSYCALATYVQHYGNYYNDAAFYPYKAQSHILYENSFQLGKNVIMTAALGYDFGDLSQNTGGLFKIEWLLK